MTEATTSSKPARVSGSGTKAERRLQLIDATIEAISRFGLSGTTMATATEIAGVSVGRANFHFESRERLFDAVLKHPAAEQRALWQSRRQGPDRSSLHLLQAIIASRFPAAICNRKKPAVWFAFHGDARYAGLDPSETA